MQRQIIPSAAQLPPFFLLSSRVLRFCCRPDGQCGKWHSPLVAFCLSILTGFLHDRADTQHTDRSPEQAGTFHATSVVQSICTGGCSLILEGGKVLLQTERLRHRKCAIIGANEHGIGVCHLRTLGCTQCLYNTLKMISAAFFKSLSTSCFWPQSLSKVASHPALALSWFPHTALQLHLLRSTHLLGRIHQPPGAPCLWPDCCRSAWSLDHKPSGSHWSCKTSGVPCCPHSRPKSWCSGAQCRGAESEIDTVSFLLHPWHPCLNIQH